MLDFGREICNSLPAAEAREWLVTNGIGGFAAGTIPGLLTRRYHGLLIAALKPPLGRTLLLTKLDETVVYNGQTYPLFVNRWAGDIVEPTGFYHLERFHLEGTTPVWTFACADALLEKRVWMQTGANTTYIRYDLRRGSGPLNLTCKAMINYRDYHSATRANGWQMQITPVAYGLEVTAFDGATPLFLLSSRAGAVPQHSWQRHYYLSLEAYRGLETVEDHLHAGAFQTILYPGQSFTLVASTELNPNLNGSSAYAERQGYEQRLMAQVDREVPAGAGDEAAPPTPDWPTSPCRDMSVKQRLALAANQFIVRRPLPDEAEPPSEASQPDGHTVLAGYPWFGDWGRDAMIALPGLTLSAGRPGLARSILQTFARFVDQGMLPNRFPDAGEAPEYNTADATLWYFHALHQYLRQTEDLNLAAELHPILADIIAWHQRGTRYNIHVDPQDGLLYAGEPGVQLTWMDAKVDDWVVTPRIGKAVEINALWHNALRVVADLSKRLRKSKAAKAYAEQADLAAKNFRRRFWFEAGGYLYDVIDGPAGKLGPDGKRYDSSLRPNQIFAASLPFPLLSDEQAKSVIDICTRHLLTPYGLRSLAPDEPAYVGRYGGDQRQRDGAYHQGTVWSWLIGPFISAHLQAYRNPALARSYLQPLIRHLAGHGLGNISEIFDGDPPFAPRGCIAQAWSVAELLRIYQELDEKKENQ